MTALKLSLNIMEQSITKALAWRFAVRTFDPTQIIKSEDLTTILESGRLAPSSFGTEPWKFIVVENKEVRAKLRAAGYDQAKITDASVLIVIARRTDMRDHIMDELVARTAKTQGVTTDSLSGFKQMLDGAVAGKNDDELDAWARAQTYIPLGTMIAAASLLSIDSGPMEGFDAAKVGEILGLDAKHLKATTMLALGYRGDDAGAVRPKVRRDFDSVVEFVK